MTMIRLSCRVQIKSPPTVRESDGGKQSWRMDQIIDRELAIEVPVAEERLNSLYWLLFSIVMFTLAVAGASLTFAMTPFKHAETAELAAPSIEVETLPASFTRTWI